MSEHDTQSRTAATLAELWPTLRQVRTTPFPCREYADLYVRDAEPAHLVIDGRGYDLRLSKRGRPVSQFTGMVELTRITGGEGVESVSSAKPTTHHLLDQLEQAVAQYTAEVERQPLQPGDSVVFTVTFSTTVGLLSDPDPDPAA